MDEKRKRGFATRAIHGTRAPRVNQETPSVPIFQTSTFRFMTAEEYAETVSFQRPGFTYSRHGNPTLQAFESLMADLEGTGSAHSFASGMAAVHTVITSLAAAGDRIVTSSELYGGAYSLMTNVLPRYGIDVSFVNAHDHDAVAVALRGAKLFYVETIANPNVTVADLERARGALPRGRGSGGRGQHVRLALPLQPGGAWVLLRHPLGDQVHRRPQRPDRRRRVHQRGGDGGRCGPP